MWPIATNVWRGPCVSVCDVRTRYPAKTAEPIEMPFGMWGGTRRITILGFAEARDDGVTVASAEPYANHLHVAPDR